MSFALGLLGIPMFMPAFLPVFGVCSTILIAIPLCLILQKAGYSPWLGLLALIPFVGVIILWVLAFSDWPAVKKNGPAPGA